MLLEMAPRSFRPALDIPQRGGFHPGATVSTIFKMALLAAAPILGYGRNTAWNTTNIKPGLE